MKKLFILFLFINFSLGINAQTEKIDSLIGQLNNNQLYGTCNYAWVLKMNSESAEKLVKIGKSTTKKLIQILENKEKGIIAHCVLSRIWVEDFKITTSFENFDEKGIVEYNYNELPFYEKNEKMIADKKILSENKRKWIKKTEK